jgi:hypothetical protein
MSLSILEKGNIKKIMYGNQFNGYCLKSFDMGRYNRIYPCSNIYQSNNNMLEDQDSFGFVRIQTIDRLTGENLPNATIIIYVTDGVSRDIPIMHLITTLNPVRIELPMANVLGTLIVGPEYDFSTYNLRADAFGYFSNVVNNIRLFPGVTTNFTIGMVPVTSPQEEPVIEERLDIPPHLRDVVIE